MYFRCQELKKYIHIYLCRPYLERLKVGKNFVKKRLLYMDVKSFISKTLKDEEKKNPIVWSNLYCKNG
jgi:hypothetical protein